MAPTASPAALEFDPAVHRYQMDGREVLSVTQILKRVGLVDLSMIPVDVLEHRRAIGQAVHQATHYLDEDDLKVSSVDEAAQPYVEAYVRFKRETGFQPLYLETRVWHPIYRYAGTFDRLGIVTKAGRRVGILGDLKCGDPELVRAGIQLAGYLEAYQQAPLPLPDIDRIERWSIALRGDATYRVHVHTDYRDRGLFLAAAQVATFLHTGGYTR